jgi:hypothetical protein
MDAQNNASPFFSLPLELREHIYAEVLSSPAQGPQLLRTCQEIQIESRKFLYQRPLDFKSQIHLHDWLNTTPDKFLTHVTDVSLSIQDVDVRALLEPGIATSRTSISGQLHTCDLYEAELHKLRESLQKLGSVKKITIRALVGRQSHLYRDFLTKLLDSLYLMYPTLHDLRLEGNISHQNLKFLGRFDNLRSFSFGGVSSSSSTETGGILSSLRQLSNLVLTYKQTMITSNSHLHGEFGARSFIGGTPNAANRLASLSIAEPTLSTATDLFTLGFLTAMHSHTTLKNLSVSVSHAPGSAMLDRLEQYLKTSAIQCLELDWPGLNAEVLRAHKLIPDHIKALWIRVGSMEAALNILLSLLERRRAGTLCELGKIVLIRTTELYYGMGNATCDRKDSAVMVEESGGIDVSVSTVSSVEPTRLSVACAHWPNSNQQL